MANLKIVSIPKEHKITPAPISIKQNFHFEKHTKYKKLLIKYKKILTISIVINVLFLVIFLLKAIL